MTTLLVTSFVALALVGAGWTRSTNRSRAAAAGRLIGAALVGLAIAITVRVARGEGDRAALFAPDAAGAAILAAGSIAAWAIALTAPIGESGKSRLPPVFLMVGSLGMAASAHDGRVLAAAVLLSAWPFVRHETLTTGKARTTPVILPIVGSALAAIGLVWLGELGARGAAIAPDLATLAGAHTPMYLLCLGLWMRMGILPFHGFLPSLFEKGDTAVAIMSVAASPAPILVARVVPGLSAWHPTGAALLATFGLVTAVYAMFVAIAQTDLLRTVGWQAAAHGGFLAAGLFSRTAAGTAGALMHTCAASAALTGIGLAAWAVKGRYGTTEIDRLGGRATGAPHLGIAFLVFGLGAAGFPGTLAFASEDLLTHGLLELHPVAALGLIAATALGAITIVGLYLRAFMGGMVARDRRRDLARAGLPDLLGRERAGFALLGALTLALGIVPSVLASGASHVAETLSASEAGAEGAEHGKTP